MSPARLFWNLTLIIVLGNQEKEAGILLRGQLLPCRGETSVASYSTAEVAALMRKAEPPLQAQRVREATASTQMPLSHFRVPDFPHRGLTST